MRNLARPIFCRGCQLNEKDRGGDILRAALENRISADRAEWMQDRRSKENVLGSLVMEYFPYVLTAEEYPAGPADKRLQDFAGEPWVRRGTLLIQFGSKEVPKLEFTQPPQQFGTGEFKNPFAHHCRCDLPSQRFKSTCLQETVEAFAKVRARVRGLVPLDERCVQLFVA